MKKFSTVKSLPTFCLVATVVYGTPLEYKLGALRAWRDHTLSKKLGGKLFIRFYYKLGRYPAIVLAKTEKCRALARLVLAPVVARISN